MAKAPIIVFEDADLVSAVNGTAFAAFVASGQTCVSGARVLVQDSIYEQFLSLFLNKVESITARMGERTYLTKFHVATPIRTTQLAILSHQWEL